MIARDVVVIACESFRRNDGSVSFKEISLKNVTKNSLSTFLLKPECSFKELNLDAKLHNSYIAGTIHKIPWQDGFVDRAVAETFIASAIENCVVFSKGRENVLALSKLFDVPVYDLGLLGAPPVERLTGPGFTASSCILPQHAYEFPYCSQVKSIKFGKWICQNDAFVLYCDASCTHSASQFADRICSERMNSATHKLE
jgi:hypothetical protein